MKRRKGWRINCDVGEALLILQPFRHFTDVTAHSPTLSLLHLRHSSFSNPSVALPTSQLILQPFSRLPTSQFILQPFRCFTYVTAHSPTLLSLLLRYRFFTRRVAHALKTANSYTTSSMSITNKLFIRNNHSNEMQRFVTVGRPRCATCSVFASAINSEHH